MFKHQFDFSRIDAKLQKKIVQGTVAPRPIAWILTKNEDGSNNLAPFSFYTMISSTMVSVSFQRLNQDMKHTYENLIREKEAVIHVVDEAHLKVMDQSGYTYPKNVSEITENDLEIESSVLLETQTLKEALISLEVKFEQDIELLDSKHEKVEANLVLMRVIGAQISDVVYDSEKQYILTEKLNPVSRLAGPNYALVKPIDYKRQY